MNTVGAIRKVKRKGEKMATFYNQATLSYGNVVKNSNIAEGEILSGITLTKTAVTGSYGAGDSISYVITLTNNGASAVDGITLTDDLGAYTPVGGTAEVTPLAYVNGSLLYYVNGAISTPPTVTTTDPLVFDGISIPAGGNVTLIYEALANEYAPLAAASAITNTATTAGTVEPLTASDSVPVRDEAMLSIAKAVSPVTVAGNGEITYTFIIQNSGNTAATATDNVVVTDTFNPILSGISATLDGTPLAEGTGYTYDATTGEFATAIGAITVPAATYTTDPTTGAVITTPGVTTLTVSGTV